MGRIRDCIHGRFRTRRYHRGNAGQGCRYSIGIWRRRLRYPETSGEGRWQPGAVEREVAVQGHRIQQGKQAHHPFSQPHLRGCTARRGQRGQEGKQRSQEELQEGRYPCNPEPGCFHHLG